MTGAPRPARAPCRVLRSTAWAVIGLLCVALPPAGATVLEGTATVGGRPAAQAVVYLEGAHVVLPAAPPPQVVMDQKNLAFVPAVLPVMRGTVIEFTNSDDVQHNVFSPSAISGKFDLGTYGPGATRTIVLNQPGDVRVLCNIHMEMEAHILVLDTPYFATTGADGRYRIADVPAGQYTLKLWDHSTVPLSRAVDLPAAGTVTVHLTAGE